MSKKIVFIFICLQYLKTFAQDSIAVLAPPEGSSFSSMPLDLINFKKMAFKSGLTSSFSAQHNDTRTLKTSGGDESGTITDSTAFPNLKYLNIMAASALTPEVTGTLIGNKSLNSESDRTIVSRTGKTISLPGETAGLRLEKEMSSTNSLNIKAIYVGTIGMLDPSLGFTYRDKNSSGISNKESISLSIPSTTKSQNDHMITRSFLRSAWGFTQERWQQTAHLSHAHVFYNGTPPPSDKALPQGDPDTTRSRSTNPSGVQPIFNPSEVDLVLLDKEIQRTTLNYGAGYQWSDHVNQSFSMSATVAMTTANSKLWYTSVKLADVTYAEKNWQIGSSLNLGSNIENFRYASLPDQWSMAAKFEYFTGDKKLFRR